MPDADPPEYKISYRIARLGQFAKQAILSKSDVIIALILRGSSVLAGFAVTFLIGSRFGPAANGQFALVMQTAMFLAVVGLLGLDMTVVRHFAKAVSAEKKIRLVLFLQIVGLGMGLMVAIAITMWSSGNLVWTRLFGNAVPLGMLLVLCILLVSRGGTVLFGGFLRSQHRFKLAEIVASLTMPLAAAMALISGLANSVEDALWATAAGGLGSILISVVAMRKHIARGPKALSIPLRPMLASSLPLWGVGITLNIGDWYGLAIAAKMLGANDAGLYRVAAQIAATLQIVTMTIFSIYTAKISAAYHADNIREVAWHARTALRLGIAASAPLALALVFGSDILLGVIGEEFRAALPVVIILIAGQFAYVLIGPSGLVLAMSGNERINLGITLVGTTFLLLSMPIAAHYGGLVGLAVCAASVGVLRQLLAYLVVRQRLGIRIWSGKALNASV